MALSRYSRPDAYTLEELRREYSSVGSKGRVKLLQRLARKGELGERMEQLAVEDENAMVRQWAARHVDLSDEQKWQLKYDPDEFVRACLWENSEVLPWFEKESDWLAWFTDATHIERLAMMRNPQVHDKFIEIVFDPEDTILGIDLEVRAQLVFAILSNKQAVEADMSSFSEWDKRGDVWGYWNMTTKQKEHFPKLWTLAAKWPPESGVPYHVFRNVSIDCETKLRIYKQCEKEPALRLAILENDLPELDESGGKARGPSKVLKAGKRDNDETCREMAYLKSPKRLEPKPVMNALSYGWAAAPSMVEILVALLFLRSAMTHFESVTYALTRTDHNCPANEGLSAGKCFSC
jgi:hypothetical protein